MRSSPTEALMLAALLIATAVSPASPQGVVKLPIVAEITGGGASVGAMWRDAVNLAVEDINKKGGILGHEARDDGAGHPDRSADLGGRHAARAQRQALRDLRHRVQLEHRGQHGHREAGGRAAVHRIGVDHHTQKGNDNIFLTSFTQDTGMAKMVRWLLDDLKAEKIALIWVNNAFGKGGHDMFVQFLKERGKTPVVDISDRGSAGRTSRPS